MSTPELKIPKLDATAFRRALAGLEDVEASGVFSPDQFRDAASDFICALAVVFNRRELDAKTLWTRIGSAIETAIAAAQGGDLERFEHHALAHVKASISVVAASEAYQSLTSTIRQYVNDEEASVAFVRYLGEHLYPAVVMGRLKWEKRKAELETERKRLAELEAESDGES